MMELWVCITVAAIYGVVGRGKSTGFRIALAVPFVAILWWLGDVSVDDFKNGAASFNRQIERMNPNLH